MNSEVISICRAVVGYKTRKEFAKALGLHPSTVARWETGKRGISKINRSKVMDLLSASNLELEDIFLIEKLMDK